MRSKMIVLSLVSILALAAIGTLKISSRSKEDQISDLEKSEDVNSVAKQVQLAKAKGTKTVDIPAPIIEYVTNIKNLDEALSYYSFLVAEPTDLKSRLQDDEIVTWYKFKIIEELSEQRINRCPTCPSLSDAPLELQNVGSREVLVPKPGGSTVLDGIKVNMRDARFPEFESARRYLLVLQTDPSKKIGIIAVGPDALFTVEDNGALKPVTGRPHRLKTILEDEYGNSVRRVREATNGRPVIQ
jgi:hypothetical protein